MIKQNLEGITVDGKPLNVYIEEQATDEIEKVKKSVLIEASRGTRTSLTSTNNKNISGKRSEYSNRVEKYSPEAIAHMNYLFKSKGEIVNTTPQFGPIEAALKDAQDKARFYRKQEVEAVAERTRWDEIAKSLQNTLNLVNGKTSVQNQTRDESTNVNWKVVLNELLSNGKLTRKELQLKIEERFPNMKRTSIYQGLLSKFRSGLIEKDADDIVTYVGK